MDHESTRFRQTLRQRSRSPAYRSRSRSPREWKRNERRPAERDGGFIRDRNRDSHSKIRLFLANIPYDVRWQDLKDLFREKVGNVSDISYVELYNAPDGKPSGTGVVEVKGMEMAKKAIDILHRSEIKGRRIVVREEIEEDRIGLSKQTQHHPSGSSFDNEVNFRESGSSFNNLMSNSGGQIVNSQQSLAASMLSSAAAGLLGAIGVGGAGGMMNNVLSMVGGASGNSAFSNTMNIAGGSINVQQLLLQLGIDPSAITNQVFVANLDYKVTAAKMEEVFRIAGNVIEVDMKVDKEGRSRGMGTVRFEHPMEAVQAIAMFNHQFLYERQMAVRMDKWVDPVLQDIPNRMPVGLKGIGSGFGTGGQPLLNIAQISNTLTLCALTGQLTLPNANVNSLPPASNLSSLGGGMLGMGNNNLMGSNNIPSLMGNLSGGAGILGNGMTGNMGGSSNIQSGGFNSGISTGGLGMNSSMGDNDMMSSGMVGNSFIGRLGGGMTESRGNDFDLQSGGGGIFNTGANGMSGGGILGSNNRFERSIDFGSSLDRALAGNLERLERIDRVDRDRSGFSGGASDTYSRAVDSKSNTVFVKNIPFSWNWQELMSKFKDCGEVRTAVVKMDNGRSRGIGTVSFYSAEDARRAIALMDGVRLDGRQLEVHLDRHP